MRTACCAVVGLVVLLFAIAACVGVSDADAQSTVVLAGTAAPGVELNRSNAVALLGGDTADSIKVQQSSLRWTHDLRTYVVPGKLPLRAGDVLVAEIGSDPVVRSASLKLWECGVNKSGSYELTGESLVFTVWPGGKITSANASTTLEPFMGSPETLDPLVHIMTGGREYSYEVYGATPWWCNYALDIIINYWNADLTEEQEWWYHSVVNAYLNNCVSCNSGGTSR